MNPIFKNYSESAKSLLDLITAEQITNPIFTYINPDAENFCRLITPNLVPFFDLQPSVSIIILDDGSTRASEFVEYTDQIKKKFPQSQIIIATPVIPASEEKIFQANCDRLLTLHIEPLFFSLDQFYISPTL